ncbi:condensation domain protein [Mycobacterium xenopi 4042]|uniref:Condensation domain protein n=1 Tax=Mycobacterium xenopi 4042 TaxID=1299334 RepID=X8DDI6_MYCXE|nr:condensation domain protein [Mycobacterium xenopi 4042]
MLPLTPLQRGLLFHAGTVQGGDDVYAVQMQLTLSGELDPDRCTKRCKPWSTGIPTWWPGSATTSRNRCKSSPPPVAPWSYVDLSAALMLSATSRRRSSGCARRTRRGQRPCREPGLRVALIRIAADQHRLVLTNHHIVLDGWSLPILLGEIFASYQGQRLPAAGSYRRFVAWLAERDLEAARAAWRQVLPVSTPRLWWPAQPVGQGSRGVRSARLPAQTTRAVSELAGRITPPSTPCCRAPSRSC